MAKATGRKKRAVESSPPERETSATIGELDAKLVALIQQRAKLFAEVCRVGQEAAAEQAASTAALDAGNGPLPQRVVRTIFREIQSGCRSLVRQTRIAFFGPSVQLQPLGRHPGLRQERAIRARGNDRRGV